MSDGGKNEWASPSILLGVFGMIAGAGGSYMAFDGRLNRAEAQIVSTDTRLARIENKIDAMIDREIGK